jgi:uncharacterized membrane protein
MYAVEWSQGIEDAWSNVAEFFPKLLAFAFILLIGWFIAKALGKAFNAVLERVGFDEAVERGGVKSALAKSKYDASDLVGKIVYYALFLLVLQAAFGVFGENPISDMINSVIAYLPKVFVAIVIVVVAAAVAAAVKDLVQNSLSGLDYGKALATFASTLIIVIGVFAALDQLEIAPSIVTGLFYAMLAIVVGSAVIAIGGAGVTEMRPYVRRALERADSEASNVKAEAQRSQSSDEGETGTRSGRQRPLTADDAATAGGGVGPYDRPAR